MKKQVKANQNSKADPFNFAPKIKEIFDNISKEMAYMHQIISNLDGAVCSYIDYKGDTEKFRDWILSKMEQHQKLQRKETNDTGSKKSGDSSRGAGANKTDKQSTEKSNKKTKR